MFEVAAAVLLCLGLAKPGGHGRFRCPALRLWVLPCADHNGPLHAGLTFYAASFQAGDIRSLLTDWVSTFSRRDQFTASFGNVYMLLCSQGYPAYSLAERVPVSPASTSGFGGIEDSTLGTYSSLLQWFPGSSFICDLTTTY